MEIKQPISPEDWKQYYALRFEVLREPWNQPLGSEILQDEELAIHAMIVENDQALAVARLHEATKGIGQVRCVAVKTKHQGKGLGKILMNYLEEEAKKRGMHQIILEARENAVPFYENLGYRISKESYLLFGEIQHYTMLKQL
ncbi:MAG: GNAT family N-acetyltransferase [Aquirufa sp.]